MNKETIHINKRNNLLHTFALLISLALLMAFIGWMIGGGFGIVLAIIACIVFLSFNPFMSTKYVLKRSRAQLLHPRHFPELNRIVSTLAQRAGLTQYPELYAMPSNIPNAFVVGNEQQASIVISESLLRNFSLREIAGILGHEIAHISNKDLYVMSMAGIAVQITQVLSTVGQIALVFALPAILLGQVQIALLPFLFLVFAPTLAVLLQLALSRTREFEADLLGVQLCGDIYGLASALRKLENYRKGLLHRFIYTPWRGQQSNLLQTHPPTEVRIERLLSLSEDDSKQQPRIVWHHVSPLRISL